MARQAFVTKEEREKQAAQKYEEAIKLYATTDMTMRAIARQCGLTTSGLQAYISRHHRTLMLARHNISAEGQNPHTVKIHPHKGPSPAALLKYKDAVEACTSLDYIELNVSQVARQFGVKGAGLANFMKVHYPDIPVWREQVRHRMGISDNTPRGPLSLEQYAQAVELYRTSEYTIPEVAERCHVSADGLSQHLRFYHQKVMVEREKLRTRPGKRKRGERVMNGKKHEPEPDTDRKYAEALALYRDTTLTLKTIAAKAGISVSGLRSYLRTWHAGLARPQADTTDKYAGPVARLKAGGCSMESAAKAYGLNPETLRQHLRKHEPDLAARLGRTLNRDGKRVSRQSEEKYAEAIRLYETTTEPLNSIAARLGLVYNSLGGYVRRNCPDAIRKHEELARKSPGE